MLPTSLEVEGVEYAIDPSFETCLDIIRAYEDPDLLEMVKHRVMVKLLFLEPPPFCEETVRAAIKFLDGGDDTPFTKPAGEPKRLFSFQQDMKFIRSAVQRTHGVNLRESSDLHWWKFLDMFMDLDENSMFSRILQLRHQKMKNKLTKEEKKLWAEMKDILVLKTPDMILGAEELSDAEKELARLESLANGKG